MATEKLDTALVGKLASGINAKISELCLQPDGETAHIKEAETTEALLWCMSRLIAMNPQAKDPEMQISMGMELGLRLTVLISKARVIYDARGLPPSYQIAGPEHGAAGASH